MSKYDPLGALLAAAHGRALTLSFAAIEKALGFSLPPSKQYPAWWSNNTSNNVMTQVWLEAGYRTEAVDIEGQKVTFRPNGEVAPSMLAEEAGTWTPAPQQQTRRSPIFGSMKGTTFVMPGIDLTAPMDLDVDPERFNADDVIVAREIEKVQQDDRLNISGKIRALNKLGVPRAEIARLLGKRYQHVRNVLIADEGKAA